jgi:hypothetical protein
MIVRLAEQWNITPVVVCITVAAFPSLTSMIAECVALHANSRNPSRTAEFRAATIATMVYSRPVSPIPRGVTMDSVGRPAPQPTPREDPALAELVAAIVWLASGYQQAIELANSLLQTPPTTIHERMTAADAIARRRAELTAVRIRVASLLDESAHLRSVPDRRHLKAASNY